ncbi:hypothetical protein BO443_120181 [Burkholderia orbicola]
MSKPHAACSLPPGQRDPVRLQHDEVRDEERHPVHAGPAERHRGEHPDRQSQFQGFAHHPAHHGGRATCLQSCHEYRTGHPADRSAQKRGLRSGARRLRKQPPRQRCNQGQDHLREHHLVGGHARGLAHVRAKQPFGLGPRQRNDVVILLLDIPVIVGFTPRANRRSGALRALIIVPVVRRLTRHRNLPQNPSNRPQAFRKLSGVPS